MRYCLFQLLNKHLTPTEFPGKINPVNNFQRRGGGIECLGVHQFWRLPQLFQRLVGGLGFTGASGADEETARVGVLELPRQPVCPGVDTFLVLGRRWLAFNFRATSLPVRRDMIRHRSRCSWCLAAMVLCTSSLVIASGALLLSKLRGKPRFLWRGRIARTAMLF